MSASQKIEVVAAVIPNDAGKILITKRPEGSHLGGLWEFPGGKIDAGESAPEALKREIKEELNAEIEVVRLLWRNLFHYPEKTIDISFFLCTLVSPLQAVQAVQVADLRWVSVTELPIFNFPPADASFIEQLRQNFYELIERPQ